MAAVHAPVHGARVDAAEFAAALDGILSGGPLRQGIGTLGEKTLHAVLKCYFQPDPEKREVKIGPYVADIADGNRIIEIQTRDLWRIRAKLESFLPEYQVTVVYPLAHLKWLCWIDPQSGEVSKRRRSTKSYTAADALPELYPLRELLADPHLHICLVFLELEEYRLLDGWSRDKKRGSHRQERIPLRLMDIIDLVQAADLTQLIPPGLSAEFTSRDFAKAARLSENKARIAVKLLHDLGLISRRGKQGRLYLYRRA